jgi:hypothetical protein
MTLTIRQSTFLKVASMAIEEIRALYQATPFQPFAIHLSDGRALPVIHRDFIAASPTGRTIVVYQQDGAFECISLRQITGLEVRPETQESASS